MERVEKEKEEEYCRKITSWWDTIGELPPENLDCLEVGEG